jgi:hypothetical protein
MARSSVFQLESFSEPTSATRIGWIVECSADRGLLVDFPGNVRGPLAARSTVALDATTLADAIATHREVLLAFDAGDEDRPIVIGLMQPTPSVTVTVDGRRVELEGKDEVVLRCGAASITLRRNGRVTIRGAYVETRAAGTNRIKGGSVQIN